MKKIISLAITFVILASVVVVFASAGTDDDPLISLSYIESVLKPYINQKVADSSKYNVVTLKKGQKLAAGEGCEFIVRSGNAKAEIPSSSSGGFTDVTDGKNLINGASIALDHSLICPRNDGRSIIAVSEVYIMVKGEYTIK